MATRGLAQPAPARAELLPLTERVLAWLPGPRWTWVALWTMLPFVRLAVLLWVANRTAQESHPYYLNLSFRLPYELVFAFLVPLALWAARKWAGEVEALRPTLAGLTGVDRLEVFRSIDSRIWPILLTLVLVVQSEADLIPQWGALVGLLIAPLLFVVTLPVVAGFWVYLSLLAGLNRLGGYRLALEPFPEDRSLGLRPVGALAFSAFWIFALGTVALLLVSIRDPASLFIALVVFLLGVAIFFFSLWRLHAQMLVARRQHLGQTSEIFSQALQPMRIAPSLDTLRQQATLLGAAEILQRQAEAIQGWPFDDHTLRVITTIVTGVVIALVSRLIFTLLGL